MAGSKVLDPVRRGVFEAATVTRDRVGTLAELAQGKRTLDVGCVGTRKDGLHPEALARHARIVAAASECLGLDIDEVGVHEMESRGYKAIVADACECSLGRRFETIVAGEIIEHVSNGGRFLANMRDHLEPGGELVLSTCNPFSSITISKMLRYGHPCVNREHTCWYDPVTLMGLALREQMQPTRLIWVQERSRLDLRVLPCLLRSYFSSNFILVLQR